MSKILFMAWICLIVCVWMPASGATLYVDDSVPQSGNGTSWQTAFKTIQEGLNAASHGDTVLVAAGTYVENIKFDGKNIVLRSDPLDPANTIIDGNQTGTVVTFDGTENETCVLSGFTITNGSGSTVSPLVSRDAGGIRGATYGGPHTHATIRNNVITANSTVEKGDGGGLFCCDGLIENNVISNNLAVDDGGGLYFCHGIIQNNQITGNWAVYGGAMYGCSGLVQNNIVSGNTADWLGGAMTKCDGTIQNNLIMGNMAVGYAGGGLEGCDGLVLNNTVIENSAGQDCGGMASCEGAVINCIVWGNTAPTYPQFFAHSKPRNCCIQDWTDGGVGNISADPLFVDAANGDLRLQASSPCINAGGNYYWLAWPQRDMGGNCRVAGSSEDIGCYEFGSSPDSDGDLLSDADETSAGTDPADEDTDDDGLRDGLEILRGSNPLATTLPETISIPAGDTAAIQRALSLAISGDEIIAAPGTYQANLIFCGTDVVLRSSDPSDRTVVEGTILDGGGIGRGLAFSGFESEACVLSGLTIKNGFAYYGGGIFGSLCGMASFLDTPRNATRATIQNNVITGNSARWVGGGLYNCDGTIQNNTISNNSSDWGYAGGLYLCNGTIQNNVISGNWADDYGGGLYECDGTIQNNVVTANSATYGGGGLFRCDGAIRSNLIAGNSAGTNGGGLYQCAGTIRNNTIAYNSAAEKGGGLYSCNAPITNCIIWGNTAPKDPQMYIAPGGTKPTYSCIQGGINGEGNIKKDPKFVATNHYHLQPSSPCIDAGINQDWMWTAFDLDGNFRIYNGRVDMGAYEYMVNLPPVVIITSPTDGSEFASGETITFRGTATDEDGDLADSLAWASSKDGTIGTGREFSTTLSNGVHTITASATDSNNATGSDSVTITVGAPATLSVSLTTNKPSYKIGETVTITVTVTDGVNLVQGAAVHAELKTPKGKTYAYDLTTGEQGTASFSYTTNTKDGTGTYTVTATASFEGYSPGSGSTTFILTR